MNYEAHIEEVARLQSLIASQGDGAGKRWMAIATAASAGNSDAQQEVAGLIGRDPETALDYYAVVTAAYDCMSTSEQHADYARATQALNGQAGPSKEAEKYLANRLGSLRRAAGMTQQQLSESSGVKITTIQKLENGSNALLGAKARTVLQLAKALGVTVEDLIDDPAKSELGE